MVICMWEVDVIVITHSTFLSLSPPPPSSLPSLPFLQELRSYSATIHVSHHHHPNIIGRKGSRIQAIREEFDVWIRLPGKGDANADEIVLTGYEHQVKACQDKILSIVQELVSSA